MSVGKGRRRRVMFALAVAVLGGAPSGATACSGSSNEVDGIAPHADATPNQDASGPDATAEASASQDGANGTDAVTSGDADGAPLDAQGETSNVQDGATLSDASSDSGSEASSDGASDSAGSLDGARPVRPWVNGTSAASNPLGFAVEDMDVAADGSIIAIGRDHLQCFSPGLVASTPVLDWPVVYPSFRGFTGVSRSRVTKRSTALLRVQLTTNTPSSIRNALYFVNEDCSSVVAGPVTNGENVYVDLEVDDAGRTVVVSRLSNVTDAGAGPELAFYDATGSFLHALSAPAGECSFGAHVSLNRRTGDGVFTCQGHSSDPIRYRRFAASGTWLDSSSRVVTESISGTPTFGSSFYDSHVVGMNDEGAFGISWVAANFTTPTRHLVMFDADGTRTAHVVLDSQRQLTTLVDEYRDYTGKVQRLGSELVFPWSDLSGESGGVTAVIGFGLNRLANDGEMLDSVTRVTPLGTTTTDVHVGPSLRMFVMDGAANRYTFETSTKRIRANAFSLP